MYYIKVVAINFVLWIAIIVSFEALIWQDTAIDSKFLLKQMAQGAVWALFMAVPANILKKQKEQEGE